jgi:hypothetical protein
LYPFINCIHISHTPVTPGTNRDQVVKRRLAALALWHIVAALIIKDIDAVRTPGDTTLGFKSMPHCRDPYLLRQGLGNLLFLVDFAGEISKLHSLVRPRGLYIG